MKAHARKARRRARVEPKAFAAESAKRARPSEGELDREHLCEAVEHAAHLLPAQAPIRIFVHHNTLHAFEDLPFDQAVVRAADTLGKEPYESEEAFERHLANGRIDADDIAAVLAEEPIADERVFEGGPTLRELHALCLENVIERVEGSALRWLLEDGEALVRFHHRTSPTARERVRISAEQLFGRGCDDGRALAALYERLRPHAIRKISQPVGPRPRDRVLSLTGCDVDALVHPLLVRVCAGFVDQGIAYWAMPGRDRGLLASFRALYAHPIGPPDPWLRALAPTLARQEREQYDAERTALEALGEMSVPRERWGSVIEATLRALPGWAGMIRELEHRPDRAPVRAPPARLMDYTALALLLEAHAVRYVLGSRTARDAREHEAAPRSDEALGYESFVLAQLAGIGPAELEDSARAAAWVRAVESVGSLKRRRLWHLAYERHHRQRVLDALLVHSRLGNAACGKPSVQAVFCIDEREESLRRHLEEVEPSIETFGYAGFFGVAMAYRGVSDVRPAPLCPVVIRPRHVVIEEAIEPDRGRAAAARRRAVGTVLHASQVGSRTFVRAGALSAFAGMAAVLPLIGRVLFPRLAERLSHSMMHAAAGGPPTRLRIERDDDTPDADGYLRGFSIAEMADIVARLFSTCGMTERLAPLVLIVGHGSSSLNNPHEAAHDCGATGGGRGGPNARAFAAMANHPRVREALAARGIVIDDETYFVGAYHNTCDDSMTYFDVDQLPLNRRADLERASGALERARRLDAHERCRRFESAPLGIDVEQALAHVESRAVDLGEPRPEYGHATNAVCFVGRRERTRGLFLDRRAFLVSYDPTNDPNGEILAPVLAAVGPVGAGISLEYYFSFVDPTGYGCGTKLPHNIVGLIGVMDGHASDLRTGLPWQMVEIHEPVRLLTIIEAEPELLERLLPTNPELARLVVNRWIQLVAWSPTSGRMHFFTPRGFELHRDVYESISVVSTSIEYYRGHREHLDPVRIEAGLRTEST